jgi:hypothetical protein
MTCYIKPRRKLPGLVEAFRYCDNEYSSIVKGYNIYIMSTEIDSYLKDDTLNSNWSIRMTKALTVNNLNDRYIFQNLYGVGFRIVI